MTNIDETRTTLQSAEDYLTHLEPPPSDASLNTKHYHDKKVHKMKSLIHHCNEKIHVEQAKFVLRVAGYKAFDV